MQSKVKYILSLITKTKLCKVQIQTDKIEAYLENMSLPKLMNEQM